MRQKAQDLVAADSHVEKKKKREKEKDADIACFFFFKLLLTVTVVSRYSLKSNARVLSSPNEPQSQ